jgi:hypothetical protein
MHKAAWLHAAHGVVPAQGESWWELCDRSPAALTELDVDAGDWEVRCEPATAAVAVRLFSDSGAASREARRQDRPPRSEHNNLVWSAEVVDFTRWRWRAQYRRGAAHAGR